MSPDDLVCAACSGRVAEGRCATCRAARDELRGSSPRPEVFLLVAAVALVLLLVLVA